MAARPPPRPVPALPLSERRKLLIRPLAESACPQASSSSSSSPGPPAAATSSSAGRRQQQPKSGGGGFHEAFELGAALGSGSLTHVRLAQRRSDAQEVAVKCTCSRDEEVQAFMREEYQLLCQLRHPSILQVLALYEQGSELWLIMELCRDGSLEDFVLTRGVFSEARGKFLFLQLLEGVHFLHRKRVVHRDLKPANVLLRDSASRLRIADFNSAKRIGASSGSSIMLTDRGTHLFSAPELRFGRLWNERVDIWAMGLTLFFMLRACLPFCCEGSGTAKLLLSGKLPDIRWEGMSKLVKNVIQQCLTVNMCDRPPAMELLVHPIFSHEVADSSTTCRQRRRRAGGPRTPSSGATEGRRAEQDPCDVFALLPACGLLRVRARRRLSQELLLSRASSGGAGAEEAPSLRTEPALPSAPDCGGSIALDAAPQRASPSSEGGDGCQMLRQLAQTKCDRSLQKQPPTPEEPGSQDRLVSRPRAQTTNLRRYWTAGAHLHPAEPAG